MFEVKSGSAYVYIVYCVWANPSEVVEKGCQRSLRRRLAKQKEFIKIT